MKVKDIGEFGLIEKITRKVVDKDVLVGIGDDAAVVKFNGLSVLTTDCMVQGDHFRTDWFTPEQVGMKAIESNVSDVIAMGGKPRFVLVSLALPKDLEVEWVERLYKGMWKSCDKHKIGIVGGNMTHSREIVINITLIGEVDKKKIALRSGAKVGDLIFVSGHLGGGRAGLNLFLKKVEGFYEVQRKYLEPKARVDLKLGGLVNSMEDISDGLAPEVGHICKESGVGAVISDIPISDGVLAVAKELGDDAKDYALFGGEDFELVYTVSKEKLGKVPGFLVGEITKEKGVRLLVNGKEEMIIKKGYDHFSNSI